MSEEQNSENSIDVGSILKLATNLIKDDAIFNSIKELGAAKLNGNPGQPDPSEIQLHGEVALVKEKLEEVLSEISEIRKELSLVKEQNKDLHELILQLGKALKGGWY